MNPLHEGTSIADILERDRLQQEQSHLATPVNQSVNQRSVSIKDDHTVIQSESNDAYASESHNDNGYAAVTTAHDNAAPHDDHHGPPLAPSKLPESVQNFLEHIFKLKKRGTTFEV
jgi:hypothetical protein